jgi:hypothetical protein
MKQHPARLLGFPAAHKSKDGNTQMHGDWLSAILSWWPFVMLIGAWILISRFTYRKAYRTKSGVSVTELCEQQLTELQRTNANLEQIITALDKRPQ